MLRKNDKKQDNQKALMENMIYEDNAGRLTITRISQNHRGSDRKQETTRLTGDNHRENDCI